MLARAFAETEDIITLYIAKLSDTPTTNLSFFLGRMPISQRLSVAGTLAKTKSDEEFERFKRVFSPGFRKALKCRNVVCHGAFLGTDDAGFYVFLTNEIGAAESVEAEPFRNRLGYDVVSYDKTLIHDFANVASASVPLIEKAFGLQSLRKKRFQQGLQPHPKGLKKRKPKARQKPPPQPSEA